MSEQEQGCSKRSDPSLGFDSCTSNDGPAMVDDGSATTTVPVTADSTSATKTNQHITKWQKIRLEEEFLSNTYPDFSEREEIATAIQLTENAVKNWFVRRRIKMRKEEDDKHLTTNVPSLAQSTAVSEQEHGFCSRFDSSAGLGPFTSNDGPATTNDSCAMADSNSATNSWIRFQKWQLDHMEKEYSLCKYPISKQREMIASAVQLTEEQVKNWFGRRRVKQRNEEKAKRLTSPSLPSTSGPTSSINTNQGNQEGKPNWIHPKSKNLPAFQFIEKWLRDQPFVPNNDGEESEDGDEAPRQTLQPDDRPAGRDRCRSPVNPNPIHDQGQEDEVSDQPFVPNYYREVNESKDGMPRQKQLPDTRQMGRNHFGSPSNPGPSHDSVSGQEVEVEVKVRGTQFIPNYYREVNEAQNEVTRQKPPDARQAGRNHFHSVFKLGLIHDTVTGQEVEVHVRDQKIYSNYFGAINMGRYRVQRQQLQVTRQAGRDLFRSLSNPGPSRESVLGQGISVQFKNQQFDPNYYREMNERPDGVPRLQQQLPDARQAGRFYFRSTSNPGASHDSVPGLEVEFKFGDPQFVPNYFREINEGQNLVTQQQRLPDSQEVGRDRFHSSSNPGPSRDSVAGQEFGVKVRENQFDPSYYREVNEGKKKGSLQQLPEARQSGTGHSHSAFIQGPNRYPVPGKEVKVKGRGKQFVHNYYKEINAERYGVPQQQQQLLDSRPAGTDYSRSPFNSGPSCGSAPSQEVELKAEAQGETLNTGVHHIDQENIPSAAAWPRLYQPPS